VEEERTTESCVFGGGGLTETTGGMGGIWERFVAQFWFSELRLSLDVIMGASHFYFVINN
jgi:hypothetical protein